MIELKGLTKRCGNRVVLDGVSVKLNNKRRYAVLGEGSRELLAMLSGSLYPCEGEVRINGFDTKKHPKKARAQFSYLPAKIPLYEHMTVEGYLRFLCEARGISYERMPGQIADALENCALDAYRQTPIARLSCDVCVRVGIAGMLIGSPDVLILDDPTRGLDQKRREEILELIERVSEEHTLFLHTTDWEQVEALCEWVLFLDGGALQGFAPIPMLPDEDRDRIRAALLCQKEAAERNQDSKPVRAEFDGEYEVIKLDKKEGR